jgi:glycosyltransferase involved in cell wall biosynthesis
MQPGPALVLGLAAENAPAFPEGWAAVGGHEAAGALPVILVAPTTIAAVHEALRLAGEQPLVVALPNLARPTLVRAMLLGAGDEVLPGPGRASLARRSVDLLAHEAGREPRHGGLVEPPPAPTGRPLDDLLAQVAARVGGHDREWTIRAYDRSDHGVALAQGAGAPFLSVLVRTQGHRPAALADVLLCLGAQSCSDFEVLLLAHDVADKQRRVLNELVGSLAGGFRPRVMVVPVVGGGRSRPLTIGIARALGRYIAVLDDDDLVMGNWVEAFAATARAAPGSIVRSVTVEQTMQFEVGNPGFRTVSWPVARWDAEFSLLSHLVDNHSPVHSCAYPREVFHELGLGFDESLPVLEDWDLLVRAASLVGVRDTGLVTAIYRRWPAQSNSFAHLAEDDWPEAAWRVVAAWDRAPVLLPAGSATRLREEGIYLLRHRPIRQRLARRVDRLRDTWSPLARRVYRRVRPRTLSTE